MITVISPAKKLNLNFETKVQQTKPCFQHEANYLAVEIGKLSITEQKDLMSISEKLAELNVKRFQSFKMNPTGNEALPAVFSFAGDTYTGLEARSLENDELNFAQDHLRILSGLYGILKPFDSIQPYRLEMGSKLNTKQSNSLYEFWGSKLSFELNEHAKKINSNTLINCASQEYFGAIDKDTLKLKIITPVFLENKENGPKIVSFFAKRARGAMARFIIQNRLTNREHLSDFDIGGYKYQKKLSSEDRPVFLR
tara:strand:+ start:2837 stop:3598 length:762 start_codon:yes stop_codon:yes gene_type:complete